MMRWLGGLRNHSAVAAVLLPQLLFAGLGGAAVLRAAMGGGAVWNDSPLNLSEALAVGDYGLAVRMMEQGHDPNVKQTTPAANDGRATSPITALEAAVQRGELWMVQVVLEHGAIADRSERLRLACLAAPRGAEDIAEFLHGSVPAPSECAQ
jgi:hypothetical protein